MKYLVLAAVLFLGLAVGGCVSRSTSSMAQVAPGQTMGEVEANLGKPDQTEFHEGAVIWKYETFKPFVGVVPYYLVFKKDDSGEMRVVSSLVDKEEYQANQKAKRDAQAQRQREEAAKKPQRVDVHVW